MHNGKAWRPCRCALPSGCDRRPWRPGPPHHAACSAYQLGGEPREAPRRR